jgi:hypothetical protein
VSDDNVGENGGSPSPGVEGDQLIVKSTDDESIEDVSKEQFLQNRYQTRGANETDDVEKESLSLTLI